MSRKFISNDAIIFQILNLFKNVIYQNILTNFIKYIKYFNKWINPLGKFLVALLFFYLIFCRSKFHRINHIIIKYMNFSIFFILFFFLFD